jgi:hypothetical protein
MGACKNDCKMHSFPLIFVMVYIPENKQQIRTMK